MTAADDYSWSLNPIHDALVVELFAAALCDLPEVEQ